MDLNFTLIPIGLLLFFVLLLFPFLVKLSKRLCPPARTRSLQHWFEYAVVGTGDQPQNEHEEAEEGEEMQNRDNQAVHTINIPIADSETDGEQAKPSVGDGARERNTASKSLSSVRSSPSIPAPTGTPTFTRSKSPQIISDPAADTSSTVLSSGRSGSPSFDSSPPPALTSSIPSFNLPTPISSNTKYLRPFTPPEKPSSIPTVSASSQVLNYTAALDLTFPHPTSTANRLSSRASLAGAKPSSRPSTSPPVLSSNSATPNSSGSRSASHSRQNSNSHSQSSSSGRTKMSKSALHSALAAMPLHRSAELPRSTKHTPIRLQGDSRRSSFSHPSGEGGAAQASATANQPSEAKSLLQNLLAITRMGSISPLSPPMFSYEPEIEELEPL